MILLRRLTISVRVSTLSETELSLLAFSEPFKLLSNLYLPTLPKSYLRGSKNKESINFLAFSAFGGSPGRILL